MESICSEYLAEDLFWELEAAISDATASRQARIRFSFPCSRERDSKERDKIEGGLTKREDSSASAPVLLQWSYEEKDDDEEGEEFLVLERDFDDRERVRGRNRVKARERMEKLSPNI